MSSAQVFQIAFNLAGTVDASLRNAFNNARSGLGNMASQSTLASGSMKILGAAAVTAGAAITGLAVGLGASVKAASEFNASMKQIEASTNMSKTEIAGMKEMSKNLYNKNLGQDWNDLAESISTAKSVTGLTGKELEAATANAIVYRDVFGEEVSQSIKATDTMMKNFGITSTEAYNLMAQGAKNGLNKSDELIDSANEYSPYFKSLGFSANQMFDTFSAGMQSGAFNLDKVGDAVKEFNIRAKDGSESSAEAYQALGMDAAKMSQIFAKGGSEAQKSFRTVVQAISKVEDPVKKNAIAVGLFGTQAEDLEKDVIAAMGTARSQFDMTRQTMEQIQNIKYDTLGMAWQGIGRQIETGVLIPIGERLLPLLTSVSKTFAKVMPAVSNFVEASMDKIGKRFSMVKDAIKKAIGGSSGEFERLQDMFREVAIRVAPVISSIANTAGPLLKEIGSTVLSAFTPMYTFWKDNGPQIVSAISNVFNTVGSIIGGVVKVVRTVFNILKPVIINIGSFITGIAAQMIDFWNTDGAQIVQAVRNVFAGISAVIKFLAPVIMFIINMVWTNVKGVIQGALNVILGIVKVFSGLFTGDFGKMWEGVKQIFFGAIQFVWNYVNLLFVGRILGGIKAFATSALGPIRGMWTAIKGFFTGGVNNAWTQVVTMGTKVKQGFTIAKNAAVSLANQMWTSVTGQFNNIVSGAHALPGRIGQGIAGMAGKALSGITTMGNKLLKGIGKMVNGVIKGLNFVMGKLSIKTVIDTWTVPQYANGINAHPGGPAILGDGKGSNSGPELYRTPQGHVGLSPGTDTLMNLPRGTQVIPARETSMLMSQYNIPAYSTGNVSNPLAIGGSWMETASDWVTGKAADVKNAVTDKVSDVKNKALDVFSYIGEPSKLFNKLLDKYGVALPDIGGHVGNIASGVLNKLKDAGLNYLTEKMSVLSFSGDGNYTFPAPFRMTSGYGPRWGTLHKGVDWAAPTGTPIPSMTSGPVVSAGFGGKGSGFGGYGNYVLIGGANGLSYLYGHNSRNAVQTGGFVTKGQTIGYVGSTGQSTGPHVHFETRKNGQAFNPGSGGGLGAAFSGSGSAVAQKAIMQALMMLGKPMSLLNPLMTIAKKESGFNPNAINDWDINARRGDPSVGLFQIIGETFRRWMYPGHGNRRNPLDSALAAIRYMDGRYGGIMNHPGIISMMKGGGYKPYYKGGRTANTQWALVGERGPELLRLPGGADIFNNRESGGMLSGLINYSRGESAGTNQKTSVSNNDLQHQFVYSPTYQFGPGTDQSMVKQATALSFEEFKRMASEWMAEQKRLSFEDE
ncbi:peptidoglycan DD-metalloendopeptidase family protein [Domibacillus aminovorans]|uniref:peptidoglycan DD-metalloendopeptidase family protein n=1 Tax=Domibacillus aminovorans TaxID=29332 RepID=UPI003D212A9D